MYGQFILYAELMTKYLILGISYHQHCQNEHPEINKNYHNYENATVLNRYQTMFFFIFQTFFDRHT